MANTTKFQTGKVFLLTVIHFFHDVSTAYLAPLLPLLREYYGFSLSFAGFLGVVQRLPTLLNPLIGILAERVKARYFVIFAPAVTATAMSLVGIMPNKGLLILVVLVSGISSCFFHIPSPVMMKKVSGNRIGMGMSFYMVGGELARTVGPVLGLGLVEIWGLSGLTRLIPAGWLATVIFYFRLKDISISDGMKKGGTSGAYLSTLKQVMPLMFLIGGIILTRAAMKSALTYYLPMFLESRGESLWFAGIALSVLQGAGVVGTMLSGSVSDFMGRRSTLFVAVVITPILFFGFLYTTGILQVVVLVLTGFFLFTTGPVFLALVHEFKGEHMNLVNAIYMTTIFIIGALMVMVVGLLGDIYGLELTFKISALFSLLGIPLVFKIK